MHKLCLLPRKLPKRNGFLCTISRRLSKELGAFYAISRNYHTMGETQEKVNQIMQHRGTQDISKILWTTPTVALEMITVVPGDGKSWILRI